MDQGNFHKVANDHKFTITWELANLAKSTLLQLNRSVDIIRGCNFFNHTNAESYLYSRSIAVLHASVFSV